MKTSLILTIVILGAINAPAQQPLKPVEPAQLITRRAEQIRTMQRIKIAPLTSYIQSLNALRQQFARESKLDSIAAIDAEIKTAKEELDAANAATNITTSAAVQLQIDLAEWGHPPTKRVKDVTEVLREALSSGKETIVLGASELGVGDVAPGQHKLAIITYTVNGNRKKKTFPADILLDFKRDLK